MNQIAVRNLAEPTVPHLLDFSGNPDEIWKAIRTTAAEAADSGLTLGFMLAQILRERPYKHLRCRNFKGFCETLGITDRKGRHLVTTSLAWQDACRVLRKKLPPPANFPLAEKLFLSRETLVSDTYQQLVADLYSDDIANSQVASRLEDVLKDSAPPENGFKSDLRRVRSIIDVAQMAAADRALLERILAKLDDADESEFTEVLKCLDDIITQLETGLDDVTEANPVPLASKGRPNLTTVDMARAPSRPILRELH